MNRFPSEGALLSIIGTHGMPPTHDGSDGDLATDPLTGILYAKKSGSWVEKAIGEPKAYGSSSGAGNGPFVGDPTLPFPFPPIPYDLSITTLPPNSTSQSARLDWTEPDVNSVWSKFTGDAGLYYKVWYANTNNANVAVSAAVRTQNTILPGIAGSPGHLSVFGGGYLIPKCAYLWFTPITSFTDDTQNVRPSGAANIILNGGVVAAGTITIHGNLGNFPNQITATFVPYTTNVITGYTIYRALTKDALDTVSALTSLGHVQTYSDTALLNPIFWYRLVGHSSAFDFPFTDLGVCRMITLTRDQIAGGSRLTWSPPLPVIRGVRCPSGCDGIAGSYYAIYYTPPSTDLYPVLEYYVWKSHDGTTFTNVACIPSSPSSACTPPNQTSPWRDSDAAHNAAYFFQAKYTNGDLVNSNTINLSY